MDGGAKSTGIVIFVHGFLGGPSQFEPLVQAVKEAGFAAESLLLPGYGGHVLTFARHRGIQWQEAVNQALRIALTKYEKVVIMGHSLGGLLGINASLDAGPAHGLVLWQTPLKLRMRLRGLRNNLAVALLPHRLQSTVAQAYASVSHVRVFTPFGYLLTLPRAIELPGIMAAAERRLNEVKGPVLIIHANEDEIVHPGSVQRFQSGLTNAQVSTVELHEAWHAYLPREEMERMRGHLAAWLKRL